MYIYIENSIEKKELSLENEKCRLNTYDNSFCLTLDKNESAYLFCNGKELYYDSPGTYSCNVVWDKEYQCIFTVKSPDKTIKKYLKLEYTQAISDEDIINLIKFASQMEDTFKIENVYPIEALYDAIKSDKVSLIIEKTPYVGYDDQVLLDRISDVIPMVMDICSHPKKSLRTEEAILDVNLVKRINSRTMDHLASHSEHWKSRSLNGLTPNRLRSDIFEDEINIYENLFFRLAINDILKYVHKQAESIQRTISQNDNAIDWNAYGETLLDYKRMQIFSQLLPDYDVVERQEENDELKKLLAKWAKLEKNFSTVEASQFFRGIDKKRHISRNIKLTNILKKDSRYNALYRLWCEIQRQEVLEKQESMNVGGGNEYNWSNCYSMFNCVLLLYVFKLLDLYPLKNSVFRMKLDGTMDVDAVFVSDNITYNVKTGTTKYGSSCINLSFVERKAFEYHYPESVDAFIKEVLELLPESVVIDQDKHKLIFEGKLSSGEQRLIKNIFHISASEKKRMKENLRHEKDNIDKIWRKELDELFSSQNLIDQKKKEIVIIPQYSRIENSEKSLEKFTDSFPVGNEQESVFLLPLELNEFKETVTNPIVASRLLNYGEKYYEDDCIDYGNYKIGILPIGQSEINSAQRLMKLISLHSSKLQIAWKKEKIICPICGSSNCKMDNDDNWRCMNSECGVLFGVTKHAHGCGKKYEWIRPAIRIKKKEIETNNCIELLLKKELIFDRLAITDFKFEIQTDGTIKYIPVCPVCGKRD